MDISVVIPTYNRYEFLKRALESVYNQTYMPNEIIVVDDGSTDGTSEIIDYIGLLLRSPVKLGMTGNKLGMTGNKLGMTGNKLGMTGNNSYSVIPNLIGNLVPTFKYIYQENSGVSSARNLGIKNSTCEWIAFLDSDDEWDTDKLKEQVAFHQNNPECLMSYTDERWIRDGIKVKIPKKYKKVGGDIFYECLSHCIIAPSAALVHKDLFDKVGLFDEELEVCEDYDLWLRISLENKIGLVDNKLITKYAGHDDQLSFKHWGMDRFRVKSLEKLLDEIPSQAGNDVVVAGNDVVVAGNDGVVAGNDGVVAGNDGVVAGNDVAVDWNDGVVVGNDGVVAGNDALRHPLARPLRHPLARPLRHSLARPLRHPRARPGDLITETLIEKYRVLLKGAIKYDRIADIKYYEEKIKYYEQFN